MDHRLARCHGGDGEQRTKSAKGLTRARTSDSSDNNITTRQSDSLSRLQLTVFSLWWWGGWVWTAEIKPVVLCARVQDSRRVEAFAKMYFCTVQLVESGRKRERVIWQCRRWCCFASEDETMRRTDGEWEMQMQTDKDCRERNGVREKENDKRWLVPLFDNVPDRVHSDSLTTTGLWVYMDRVCCTM